MAVHNEHGCVNDGTISAFATLSNKNSRNRLYQSSSHVCAARGKKARTKSGFRRSPAGVE
jgi:hypothetical protein